MGALGQSTCLLPVSKENNHERSAARTLLEEQAASLRLSLTFIQLKDGGGTKAKDMQ